MRPAARHPGSSSSSSSSWSFPPLLLLPVALALPLLPAAALASASAPASPGRDAPALRPLSGGTAGSSSGVVVRREETPGSSCTGSEGQWNCMTDSFQRCAAGQWSVAQDCAAGTVCSPSGLTYDFHVEFSSSSGSGSSTTSGAVPTTTTTESKLLGTMGLFWTLVVCLLG
ncbi:hypothetical protein GGR56DRAFT_214948 [Xylariaceae sp. FL0804]|nr:hypothetical protein GGR56DRAFT_214948 [Xylariaceae sp. FL0804]